MNGILELEVTEAGIETDTWIMRLPKEVCNREGFAEGTLVSLTIKNGGIQSNFIYPPRKEIQDISKKLLEKDRELHRRLKEIGD
jgi:hypothetical protein